MARQFFVSIYRWAGLSNTVFLILAGLTCGLLALKGDLERLICPRIYARVTRGAPWPPSRPGALGPPHAGTGGRLRIATRTFIAVAAIAGAARATVAEDRAAFETFEVESSSSKARNDTLRAWRLAELEQAQSPVATAPKPGASEDACDGVLVPTAQSKERLCIKPGSGESFRDCADCPEMVIAPSGSFNMGSPLDEPERESWRAGTESPQHEVTIAKPFAVGRFPVTRGEWARFVQETGLRFEGGCRVSRDGAWKKDETANWLSPGFEQDEDHPVVCLNWEDAKAYASWLSMQTGKSYRLLSEAEYEFVARAGTTSPFWWGASITPEEANYDGNTLYAGGGSKGEYRAKTVPVKSFKPNAWGFFQVHGNAWSWVEDCWHDNYNGAPTDGAAWQSGDCSRHVIRGGNWHRAATYLRAASRYWSTNDRRYFGIGFRVGRTID